MNFAYTEDQDALRELARKILGDLATHERLCEIEAGEDGWDRELWRELGRANLLGACLPEAHGGMGLGVFELCILLEETGRHVAPVPLWPTLCLAALPIARFGSEQQKSDLLPGVIAGETVLTGAFEESDTTAERAGDGWRLFGQKICVPAAHAARRVLVPAETGTGPALFLLDPSADGVRLERQRSTNREPLFTLFLEGAPVSEDDRLGTPEQGATILEWTLERATTGLCALQLGVADRALQMTAEYARERQQFDRPIGSFQAVHQRAADAYIQLEGMRLTLLQAAHRLEQNEPASLEVSVAKIWAAEGGNYTTYAAQHLHGGIGMDNDYPLHRSYLWTRHIELLLGSSERHLEKLASSL
jgi:alkylation response protein AidB-like acyl-CoA dehydrogenase